MSVPGPSVIGVEDVGRRRFDRRLIEEAAGGGMGGEQLLDAGPQGRIAVAGSVEEGGTLSRVGNFQGLDKE